MEQLPGQRINPIWIHTLLPPPPPAIPAPFPLFFSSFSHRVKGVSMCDFSMDEVEALRDKGGNERVNKKLLARYDAKGNNAFPSPTLNTPPNKLREWIKVRAREQAASESRNDYGGVFLLASFYPCYNARRSLSLLQRSPLLIPATTLAAPYPSPPPPPSPPPHPP